MINGSKAEKADASRAEIKKLEMPIGRQAISIGALENKRTDLEEAVKMMRERGNSFMKDMALSRIK